MSEPRGNPFKEGRTRQGGRGKGTPNKTTSRARQALSAAVEGNADNVSQWLNEVYEKDGPKAAIDCYVRMAEFVIPKLARQEVVGDGGGPVGQNHEVEVSKMSDSAVEELMAVITSEQPADDDDGHVTVDNPDRPGYVKSNPK